MHYYLIVGLQAYCIYHCYTHKNPYFWYWIIFLIPALGAMAYLITQVFTKSDMNKVQDGLITVMNPGKKIKDLEKKFKFSATFENQVALADAYLEIEQWDKAIENYEASLQGTFQNDFYVISKLEEAHYFSSRFDEAIAFAERIVDSPKFKKSRASFLYGLALEKTNKLEAAETYLKSFDVPYSKYQERLVLGQFYMRNKKPKEAKVIFQEIVDEGEGMSKQSYRMNKVIIRKAHEILATLA